MYRRRWRHIHAFIGRNTIALRMQRFAAGANVICITYGTDWWAAIGPVIHGESKSQATRSSLDHVGLLHTLSTIDIQESKLGCVLYWRFWPNWWRKFELGIPQSRGASYIRGGSYIRDKTVNMLDPQSHHNPQPKRSSSSGTLNMIPPWNIHTVKQSMPRSCSNGCSFNWFTPWSH